MKKVYLIATLVAIIAGIATYFFATQIQQNTKIKDAPTKSVVVAIVPIPENTIITPAMVTVKQYTSVSVVADAANKLEEVVGKLNRYPIVNGEQIIKSKLNTLGEIDKTAALSYQLKKGEYAYSISVDNIQGVSGFISRGDFVDILYTYPDANQKSTTKILMSDIQVIRISNYTSNYTADSPGGAQLTSYAELVLSLTKAQIIELTQSLSEGSIKLALKTITTGADVTKPVA